LISEQPSYPGLDLGTREVTSWPYYLARWQENYSSGRGM